MDFKALSKTLKRPPTVFNEDLGQGIENIKNAAQGLPPEDQAPVQPSGLQGAGPVQGSFPGQTPDGDEMSDKVAQMQAMNQAQAAQDPNMAARLAATQAAIQRFRDQQEAAQVQKLQGLPLRKKFNDSIQ